MRRSHFHEDFKREEEIRGSSDRSFGLVFCGFCFIAGGVRLWHGAPGALYWWAASALFLAAALFIPDVLSPLNRLWLRFGLALHKVINPVIMALMFYGAVVPTGIIFRLAGKDPLKLRRDTDIPSYWTPRQPPGPFPGDMKNQF